MSERTYIRDRIGLETAPSELNGEGPSNTAACRLAKGLSYIYEAGRDLLAMRAPRRVEHLGYPEKVG